MPDGARLPAFLVAAALVGCGPSTPPVAIVPDPATGRRAMAALAATWKAGHTTGIVEPTSPRVQVVDTRRKPGQTLVGIEILSESADSRAREYGVRLDLAGPEEHPVARFLAVGIDPILVFRREDYELLMHWEHPMDPGTKADGGR